MNSQNVDELELCLTTLQALYQVNPTRKLTMLAHRLPALSVRNGESVTVADVKNLRQLGFLRPKELSLNYQTDKDLTLKGVPESPKLCRDVFHILNHLNYRAPEELSVAQAFALLVTAAVEGADKTPSKAQDVTEPLEMSSINARRLLATLEAMGLLKNVGKNMRPAYHLSDKGEALLEAAGLGYV